MARRLKVFRARLGFYDSVVAAPSRAAALRAWGVRQDLFASGEARETTDAAAVEAAAAHPGASLQRAVGTDGPFAPQPQDLPRMPEASPKAAPRRAAEPTPAPPPPDRRALDSAEAALRELEAARGEEEARLRARQEALDEEKREAQRAYVEARRKAAAELEAARAAFRRAGGKG